MTLYSHRVIEILVTLKIINNIYNLMPKMGYSRLTRSIYGTKYTVPHLVNIFGTIKLEIRYPIE